MCVCVKGGRVMVVWVSFLIKCVEDYEGPKLDIK